MNSVSLIDAARQEPLESMAKAARDGKRRESGCRWIARDGSR